MKGSVSMTFVLATLFPVPKPIISKYHNSLIPTHSNIGRNGVSVLRRMKTR